MIQSLRATLPLPLAVKVICFTSFYTDCQSIEPEKQERIKRKKKRRKKEKKEKERKRKKKKGKSEE